jgi:hypothetical protein
MKRHKVRFNLSRGENYMKWKVMYKDGKVEYYRPIDVQIVMSGCTLKNSRVAAQKIFTGETTKVVCAWVLCDEIEIITENFKTESNTRIKYNPRELPYWNLNGKNMDGENVKELYSVDFGLYVK